MDDESESESVEEVVEEQCSTDNEDSSCNSEGARRQFLPLEGSKSKVWEHFGFLARDGKYCEPDKKKRKVVYCKVYESSYKYCGNTTNM